MEKSTFFNSSSKDRAYFAEDYARHLSKFFTNGVFDNGCLVLAENNDMSISLKSGSAHINGYRYDNDSIKILTIEHADGVLNRIDNVVLRLDLTNRNITSQIIKGNFADNPVAPDLVRNSNIYDLRIAKINIPAGTTTITQDLITDTRFFESDCGNVICAVETPNTENLFIQLQAIFDKKIDDINNDFENWFDNIKNILNGDVAGSLATKISSLEQRINNECAKFVKATDEETAKKLSSNNSDIFYYWVE